MVAQRQTIVGRRDVYCLLQRYYWATYFNVSGRHARIARQIIPDTVNEGVAKESRADVAHSPTETATKSFDTTRMQMICVANATECTMNAVNQSQVLVLVLLRFPTEKI